MHRSDVRGEFPDTESDTVTHDLTVERPRELARYDELTTEYGSPSHVSEQKSRSADQRKNLVDNEFLDADGMPIEDALEELEMPQEYHVHPADTAGGVADPPPPGQRTAAVLDSSALSGSLSPVEHPAGDRPVRKRE